MVVYTKIPINIIYKSKGFSEELDLTVRLNHTQITGAKDNPHGTLKPTEYSFSDIAFNEDLAYLTPYLNDTDKKELLEYIKAIRIGAKTIAQSVPEFSWEKVKFEVLDTIPQLQNFLILKEAMKNEYKFTESVLTERGINVIAVNKEVFAPTVALFDIFSMSLSSLDKKEEGFKRTLNNTLLKPSDEDRGYVITGNGFEKRDLSFLISALESFEIPQTLQKRFDAIAGLSWDKNMKPLSIPEITDKTSDEISKKVSNKLIEAIKDIIKNNSVDKFVTLDDTTVAGFLRGAQFKKLDKDQSRLKTLLNELPTHVRNIAIETARFDSRDSLINMFEIMEKARDEKPLFEKDEPRAIIGTSMLSFRDNAYVQEVKQQALDHIFDAKTSETSDQSLSIG